MNSYIVHTPHNQRDYTGVRRKLVVEALALGRFTPAALEAMISLKMEHRRRRAKPCSRCYREPARKGQRWCSRCHAEEMKAVRRRQKRMVVAI